jgi:hypothetical protein
METVKEALETHGVFTVEGWAELPTAKNSANLGWFL